MAERKWGPRRDVLFLGVGIVVGFGACWWWSLRSLEGAIEDMFAP